MQEQLVTTKDLMGMDLVTSLQRYAFDNMVKPTELSLIPQGFSIERERGVT
jgi:hypothetical protein